MVSDTHIPDSLIWYPDNQPGITRHRAGSGFSYTGPDGTKIDRGAERKRIEALAVPPAYDKVWISPRKNGHLLATGYDARARKQYRNHPDLSAFRARNKFDHLAAFGQVLPLIRRRVHAALAEAEGDETFAIAAALRLIDRASLRIGTPDYATDNQTYGATTLRGKHLRLDDKLVQLDYSAKGGQGVRKRLNDRTLHRALEQMDDLPGGALMQYFNDAGDVQQLSPEKAMSEAAADVLHNTATIARNSYIHPDVIALSDGGTLPDTTDAPTGLHQPERASLALLT